MVAPRFLKTSNRYASISLFVRGLSRASAQMPNRYADSWNKITNMYSLMWDIIIPKTRYPHFSSQMPSVLQNKRKQINQIYPVSVFTNAAPGCYYNAKNTLLVRVLNIYIFVKNTSTKTL